MAPLLETCKLGDAKRTILSESRQKCRNKVAVHPVSHRPSIRTSQTVKEEAVTRDSFVSPLLVGLQ